MSVIYKLCLTISLVAPQAVDHPYLVVYSRTSTMIKENMVDTENGEQVCGICDDPLEDPVVSYSFLFCYFVMYCLCLFSAVFLWVFGSHIGKSPSH